MNRPLCLLALLSSICLTIAACGPAEEENSTTNNQTDNKGDSGFSDLMNPLAGDADAATAGAALYASNTCGACHGSNGEGSSASNNVKLSDTANTRNDGYIFTVIQQGGPAVGLPASMPAYSNLSETETWQLVTHIRTLAP